MAESENYKKGTEIRRKLMGEKYADAMNKSVYDDPMMKKFGDYAREAVFGMLWSRPGLDMKTRALICVISDTVPGALAGTRHSSAHGAQPGLDRGRIVRSADASLRLYRPALGARGPADRQGSVRGDAPREVILEDSCC